MKYDFAGRLTFNQFGMGLNQNNSNVRVYQQSLQYDGFSMLTERTGLNWGNEIGFTNTYQNGRNLSLVGTYDAAGNITAQYEDAERPQYTKYDAAGRRTAMINGWEWYAQPTHWVFEHQTEYKFDGDGRPVMEGQGTRQVNVQNPPPLQVTGYAHQVWSTVLGKSLMTIGTGGYKAVTNIYAGGALIAKQGASGATWTTADPVTGTTAQFTMINDESVAEVVEESEPLGQTITSISPPEDGFDTYTAYKGNVGEPEWQCQIPETYYGNFDGMPWHCVFSEMLKKGLEGEQLWYIVEKPQSPTNLHHDHNSPAAPGTQDAYARMMKYAILSTTKPMDDEGDDDEADEPIRIDTWTFQRPERVSNPIEFNNAENGLNPQQEIVPLGDIEKDVKDYLANNPNCANFINNLLTRASQITGVQFVAKPFEGNIVSFTTQYYNKSVVSAKAFGRFYSLPDSNGNRDSWGGLGITPLRVSVGYINPKYKYIISYIHESIHNAAVRGSESNVYSAYTDKVLAQAVVTPITINGKPAYNPESVLYNYRLYESNPSLQTTANYSELWDHVLKLYCPRPKESN